MNDIGLESLEMKQERIKKLRDEFNDIKNQFTAACAAIPIKDSSLNKRGEYKPKANPSLNVR